MQRWSRVVNRSDSPSDDSATSYIGANGARPNADDRGEPPTSFVDAPTSFVRPDDMPTSIVPAVTVAPAPPPKRRTPLMIVATWAGFAVVAVVVVAATSAWAASLRGPDDGQSGAPSLANVPTVLATTTVAAAPEPPPPAPTVAAEEPGPTRPKVARGQATTAPRAPVVPPPTPVIPPPPPPPPPTSDMPEPTLTAERRPCFPGETNVPPGCVRNDDEPPPSTPPAATTAAVG